MVLPNTTAIPEEIRNCLLQDTDYYRIFSVQLHHLIDKEFIEAFVKRGKFLLSLIFVFCLTLIFFCVIFREKEKLIRSLRLILIHLISQFLCFYIEKS